MREAVKDKVKDKKLREVVLKMMAILQNSTSLQEAVQVWKVWCTVLKNRHKSREVNRALVKMNKMLREASSKSLQEEIENVTCNEGKNNIISTEDTI